ncbi:hypothetical protein ACWDKQ_22680 [Saccharopolyspora sp. NPDC000995]
MASVTSARRRSVSTVVNVVLAVIALMSCFLLGRGARNGLRADLKANPLPSPEEATGRPQRAGRPGDVIQSMYSGADAQLRVRWRDAAGCAGSTGGHARLVPDGAALFRKARGR